MKQVFAPQLVALSEGTNISLNKPIVLVGRHQECDVQIPSRKISRRHCCIAYINDHLVVRDLGSTNGVRINGIKVVEGNLEPNDELTIGNMRYQVKLPTSVDQTAKEPNKNGIKPAPAAPPARIHDHNQSYDEPLPLMEDGALFPVLESKPKASEARDGNRNAGNGIANNHFPFDMPDEVGLIPLQPPPQS